MDADVSSLQFDPCPRAGEPMVSRRRWSPHSMRRGRKLTFNQGHPTTSSNPALLAVFELARTVRLASRGDGSTGDMGTRRTGPCMTTRDANVRSTAHSRGKPLCGEKAAWGTAHRLPCSGWTHEHPDMKHRVGNARREKCRYDFYRSPPPGSVNLELNWRESLGINVCERD